MAKKKTTVFFEPEEKEIIRELAFKERISTSEWVARLVRDKLLGYSFDFSTNTLTYDRDRAIKTPFSEIS